ncbi:ParB/RepB/Spo0J family partition protein [Paenibacillus roseipurpureus]|uniref:ParB/RepB/Spo0J family partition protein n=1 Tax=Paenibacillus roseopurpureus TaxID=2918901 RepID=A0AA96RJR6_9BACL|nr:ParB/RepB/Spo0J family partition protein [Paenibacillus sp. MBLB1832]WNR45693.1 ParB/RepB/Spo0J family partition protein [Paenibacillus sp. MBLB1832]
MDIQQIPMGLIDEDIDQPRYQFDEEALQELMKSISEIGLLSPIKVRTTADQRYKIIYGNRRYKASRMLGLPSMPCIVSNVTNEMEIYLEQIAENLTREGFSPIEEGEAFHKLLHDAKFSSSVKYLSGKLGKPEAYIKNKCDLLKFGNAVKKLIVSGTEIRKDKLTEDQLLPLKDLPIEHRDPLALIMARDEMPVSDVKKIAKMFKDKDISETIKGKLLYKSGPELVETWSTFQNNRAERAKPASVKAPAKAEKVRQAAMPVDEVVQANAVVPPVVGAAETETAAVVHDTPATPRTETSSVGTNHPLQVQLQQVLNAISSPPSSSELQLAQTELNEHEKEKFKEDVTALVTQLEKQLDAWKKVQDLVVSR